MSWANIFIEKLLKNETVTFRPRGNSMKPKINSGDLVTVSPDLTDLDVGDIVLCKVKGRQYLHLIKAKKQIAEIEMFLIGNNRNHLNGWTGINGIFGRVVKVG